ncbi:leucyl aminopeptidase [Motilimonas sp. E26]|uniref:leucyl aminopeptidase n=1 Tax=Motilimonas sp. E26 TaxID=2865674 RepID=UPI001E64C363|nr:leucyl aminopeptidase [Motilimonas sp. E26]MCE0557665.1 leucyl aminopeptidase [Motilimonas sp. E26]
MNFIFATPEQAITGSLVVPVFKDDLCALSGLSAEAQIKTLIEQEQISTKAGVVTPFFNAEQPLILVGAGKREKFSENELLKLVQNLAVTLKESQAQLSLLVDVLVPEKRDISWTLTQITQQWLSSLYSYDITKSEKTPVTKTELLVFITENTNDAAVTLGQAIANGMNVTKQLGDLPSNICTPTYLAKFAAKLAEQHSEFEIEVLEETDMEALGMGSFLSVSKGSDEAAKLIVLQYQGGEANQAPHVLVGKGLTFDSGGISLKPGAGMEEMKYDMGGAAAVLGTMHVLSELKPALNVIAIIAAAENMPSARASKPGDVVTSMSGKTIEIINTDAEGRLVLADALTYAERFNPASVVDIATLTGAVIVGLGVHPTAVYANDDNLSSELLAAGNESWDRGWPMPLWDDYAAEITSPFADLRNTGSIARAGGSITAAMFLKAFAEKYTWAHLDIAGTAWQGSKGATGRPVPMLTQYLLAKQAE